MRSRGQSAGKLFWLAEANQPLAGLYSLGSAEKLRIPLQSYRPSPGTGNSPSPFLRTGAKPMTCQPVLPSTSA